MSLAFNAAPFDNDKNQIKSNNIDTDTPIARKRITNNNRTQKRMPKENNYSEKVNSVLQSIHNLPEQQETLGDFNPLPPPMSVGVEQTRIRENSPKPSPLENEYNYNNESIENVNESENGNGNGNENMYKRFMPDYGSMYKNSPHNLPYYNSSNNSSSNNSSTSNPDILIDKLNYMINLLEEQQDERIGNVTEEVVLYSFLGIFIIFIVDSFARVGKYTR